MADQLLFTSAAEGLSPGSTGYCTVEKTRDMSESLESTLRRISSYDAIYHPTPDPQNPVCFNHVVVSAGRRSYNVLSRLSDYAADYSGRSNYLAHHVVPSGAEMNRAQNGPASVLAHPAVMKSEWPGTAQYVDALTLQAAVSSKSPECGAWREVCGGTREAAGWAGVLAEWTQQSPHEPIYVLMPAPRSVSRPAGHTLQLVSEALALLPPQQRWQVTFSTYYSELLADANCQWRFVVDGSPGFTAARGVRHGRVIDLTGTLGALVAPGDGSLVHLAQTGQQPGPVQEQAVEQQRAAPVMRQAVDVPVSQPRPPAQTVGPPPPAFGADSGPPSAPPSSRLLVRGAYNSTGGPPSVDSPALRRQRARAEIEKNKLSATGSVRKARGRSKKVVALLAVVGVCVLAGVGFATYKMWEVRNTSEPGPVAKVDTTGGKPNAGADADGKPVAADAEDGKTDTEPAEVDKNDTEAAEDRRNDTEVDESGNTDRTAAEGANSSDNSEKRMPQTIVAKVLRLDKPVPKDPNSGPFIGQLIRDRQSGTTVPYAKKDPRKIRIYGPLSTKFKQKEQDPKVMVWKKKTQGQIAEIKVMATGVLTLEIPSHEVWKEWKDAGLFISLIAVWSGDEQDPRLYSILPIETMERKESGRSAADALSSLKVDVTLSKRDVKILSSYKKNGGNPHDGVLLLAGLRGREMISTNEGKPVYEAHDSEEVEDGWTFAKVGMKLRPKPKLGAKGSENKVSLVPHDVKLSQQIGHLRDLLALLKRAEQVESVEIKVGQGGGIRVDPKFPLYVETLRELEVELDDKIDANNLGLIGAERSYPTATFSQGRVAYKLQMVKLCESIKKKRAGLVKDMKLLKVGLNRLKVSAILQIRYSGEYDDNYMLAYRQYGDAPKPVSSTKE